MKHTKFMCVNEKMTKINKWRHFGLGYRLVCNGCGTHEPHPSITAIACTFVREVTFERYCTNLVTVPIGKLVGLMQYKMVKQKSYSKFSVVYRKMLTYESHSEPLAHAIKPTINHQILMYKKQDKCSLVFTH